ncbi:MAG: RIP metalloprotease RseP [Runella slithyformis]|jgi:regulator of sigma E protease|nr:MAG: RIP metalloprotease RseP [Runella slithyformis]
MEILIMAGQLILGLSILVGLHELGHLLTAKLFGMRVEKYYIGFPPKVISIQRGETEYGIGAIPLGGFVKIAGMVDESLDTKNLSATPEPWEFRAKPAWQRLIVMLGGIFVNVVTGIIIFVALTYSNGRYYYDNSDLKYGIVAHQLAQEIGLKTGDKIVAINGKAFNDFADVNKVLLESNSYYTVERNGQRTDVLIPNNFYEKIADKANAGQFIDPVFPFKVGEIGVGMPAAKAGMKMGDRIVKVNNTPIRFYHEVKAALAQYKNQQVTIEIDRAGQTLTLPMKVTEEGTIGFFPDSELQRRHQQFTLGESLVAGTNQAFGVVFDQIKAFGKIFRGEMSAQKSLGSFITIGKVYGPSWDWNRFWSITGLLSMVLAFMNLLPIPALDGGHTVFLLYEIISGRKPSDQFLEGAQKVGMVLLLCLMVFAIGNDIFKLF